MRSSRGFICLLLLASGCSSGGSPSAGGDAAAGAGGGGGASPAGRGGAAGTGTAGSAGATAGGAGGGGTGGLAGRGGGGAAGTSAPGGRGGTSAAAGASGAGWQLDPAQCVSLTQPAFPTRAHPLQPTALWSSTLARPRPTNTFWMNLVLNLGAQRINVLPYQVKAQADGLGVSSPPLNVSETAILTADRTDVRLSARETPTGHQVTAYDDLSVTVTWTAAGGTFATPLVYGMPYATALYQALTPSIELPSTTITAVNGSTAGTATGDKLVVTLGNGQTWNVYASSSLTWSWTSAELRAAQPFSGWVRVALIPQSAAAAVLDAHAAAIPLSGSVALARSGNDGLVRFDWQTQGAGPLLMMALPHHLPRLGAPGTQPLTHATISGTMTAVSGASWTLAYPLSPITWTAPRAPQPSLVAAIQAALQQDSAYAPGAQDPYGAGKELAKLARLTLIARELGMTSLADTFLGRLRTAVTRWLDATNGRPLVYDTTWGGVVSAAGLDDAGADFGNGYYNDHYFHYGYLAYAAAVVAREDSAWAASNGAKLLWLVRDIASPCRNDPYFPRFRHMDWFKGHSWAAGLFEFADNRNQESTSEAVNAWYAVELAGEALGNPTYTNVGAILRATEVASAQAYWQVTDASPIYPAPFKNNNGVGLVWSTKVEFGTWFGSNPEYIYGIQMLPFTPASEDLLHPTWIADAWPQMSAAAAGAAQGWKGFMYMAHAVADRAAATTEVQALTGYDNGNSRANTLYWVATRP